MGDFLKAILDEYGVIIALLFVAVIWLAWLNNRLHHARYEERQKEIDRLAADNRDYRDRFMRLIEKAERKSDDN